jgi:hypothetical protein
VEEPELHPANPPSALGASQLPAARQERRWPESPPSCPGSSPPNVAGDQGPSPETWADRGDACTLEMKSLLCVPVRPQEPYTCAQMEVSDSGFTNA